MYNPNTKYLIIGLHLDAPEDTQAHYEQELIDAGAEIGYAVQGETRARACLISHEAFRTLPITCKRLFESQEQCCLLEYNEQAGEPTVRFIPMEYAACSTPEGFMQTWDDEMEGCPCTVTEGRARLFVAAYPEALQKIYPNGYFSCPSICVGISPLGAGFGRMEA